MLAISKRKKNLSPKKKAKEKKRNTQRFTTPQTQRPLRAPPRRNTCFASQIYTQKEKVDVQRAHTISGPLTAGAIMPPSGPFPMAPPNCGGPSYLPPSILGMSGIRPPLLSL